MADTSSIVSDTTTFKSSSALSTATTLRPEDKPEAPKPKGYYYTETRIVKEIPKSYLKEQGAKPLSKLDKLRNKLKPPVVKMQEQLPKTEGVTYHVNEKGEIIETRMTRATMAPSGSRSMNAAEALY